MAASTPISPDPEADGTTRGGESPRGPHDEGLQAATDRLDEGSGDGQFQTGADATILCLTCREHFGPETQRADDVARVEGASDPADLSMLVAVECPNCGTRGALVVRYGPEASADEADLLVALDRSPHDTAGS